MVQDFLHQQSHGTLHCIIRIQPIPVSLNMPLEFACLDYANISTWSLCYLHISLPGKHGTTNPKNRESSIEELS